MVRVPLIAVGAAAYLGLPVLGWGGFAPLFSHPALIALAVGLAALTGVSFFAGGNLSPGVREDRGNRWVLVVPAGLRGPEGDLDYRRRYRSLAWRGSLRCRWCSADLAGFCARQSDQRVGRHPTRTHTAHQRCIWCHPLPSYLGLLVNSLGWGLASRSGVGVLLTALMLVPVVVRIRAEERLLRSAMSIAYCARTSR